MLVCKTCNILWNRDNNASRNIRQIVDGYEDGDVDRPSHLQRTKKKATNEVAAMAC